MANPGFHRPSATRLRAFFEQQRLQPFSYAEVGCTRERTPAGYDHDHNRVLLGSGPAVFERARAALQGWQMFPRPWASVERPAAPIEAGATVVVLFHLLGLWWLNACRIVYVIEEGAPARRSGFAYGTLPDHVERGEERFSVEWLADDTVWYDILAFSRPAHALARLGYPLARRMQRRFVRESQAAMQAAAGSASRAGAGALR